MGGWGTHRALEPIYKPIKLGVPYFPTAVLRCEAGRRRQPHRATPRHTVTNPRGTVSAQHGKARRGTPGRSKARKGRPQQIPTENLNQVSRKHAFDHDQVDDGLTDPIRDRVFPYAAWRSPTRVCMQRSIWAILFQKRLSLSWSFLSCPITSPSATFHYSSGWCAEGSIFHNIFNHASKSPPCDTLRQRTQCARIPTNAYGWCGAYPALFGSHRAAPPRPTMPHCALPNRFVTYHAFRVEGSAGLGLDEAQWSSAEPAGLRTPVGCPPTA